MKITLNVNETVKVKLTDRGRAILLKEKYPKDEDSLGYSKWRLWELMSIFGEHLYNGCELTFENEIIIHEVD